MSSTAPKRRLNAPLARQRGGKRAAPRRESRGMRRFLPSPAFVGAAVLMVAGAGAVGLNPQVSHDSIEARSQIIDSDYAGTDATAMADTAIHRSFDRNQKQKQVEAQAQHLQRALAADSAKVRKRADELEKIETKKASKKAAASGDVEGKDIKVDEGQWVLPVTGYNLTARFGESSGMWSSTHTGLDFAGPSGSKIVAVAGGTVKSAGNSGAYGNRTVITLKDGTEIWYAHQSSIEVSEGQKVAPGDTIGRTGATGNVTGPHLHLEVRPGGGDPVDPYDALVSHNVNP